MAIKIKVNLSYPGPITISANSILTNDTKFSSTREWASNAYKTIRTVQFSSDKLYKSMADYDEGNGPFEGLPLELEKKYFKTLTDVEYASLAGANALGIVQGWFVQILNSPDNLGANAVEAITLNV